MNLDGDGDEVDSVVSEHGLLDHTFSTSLSNAPISHFWGHQQIVGAPTSFTQKGQPSDLKVDDSKVRYWLNITYCTKQEHNKSWFGQLATHKLYATKPEMGQPDPLLLRVLSISDVILLPLSMLTDGMGHPTSVDFNTALYCVLEDGLTEESEALVIWATFTSHAPHIHRAYKDYFSSSPHDEVYIGSVQDQKRVNARPRQDSGGVSDPSKHGQE
ncbi:hypothetical protein J3A83DRAFT_4186285 [Scleroderma citrinum]